MHDADCTFSPRISEYSHLLQRSSGPTAMYERGVEFLQERESRRQAEQERLVPNFTPASFTLDHVELAEAAELGAKDPEAMYRRSQLQQQQREARLHTAAAQMQPTHAPELDEHSRRLTDHASLDPSRATAASRAQVAEVPRGGPPMTAVAAANAAAVRQAARMARTPVRPSFRAFMRKSEEHLGRREARRAAGLLAEDRTGCQLVLPLWTMRSCAREISELFFLGTPPASCGAAGPAQRSSCPSVPITVEAGVSDYAPRISP